MEQSKYKEMLRNLEILIRDGALEGRRLYVFGHCNATEELLDILLSKGYKIEAIIDNNDAKHGKTYRSIPIVPVVSIISTNSALETVFIVSRFFEAMSRQLRSLGYSGRIEKLVDYNTYAEYSLTLETITGKKDRLKRGLDILERLRNDHCGSMKIFCPFAALGDVYYCMEYLPAFLRIREFKNAVIVVISESCRSVVSLFGCYESVVLNQTDFDSVVQAVIYSQDEESFIAHQDRPYVIELSRVLYAKKIPLETIYEKGVFGLSGNKMPVKPTGWKQYSNLNGIEDDTSVILSPYAKSVPMIHESIWKDMTNEFLAQGRQVWTNVFGDEKPIEGTKPISPMINEMRSVVEKAGLFIGIRSGLCDILSTARCRKIALYPDYYYSDTKWKALDMYRIKGFDNINVKDGDTWIKLRKKIMK